MTGRAGRSVLARKGRDGIGVSGQHYQDKSKEQRYSTWRIHLIASLAADNLVLVMKAQLRGLLWSQISPHAAADITTLCDVGHTQVMELIKTVIGPYFWANGLSSAAFRDSKARF